MNFRKIQVFSLPNFESKSSTLFLCFIYSDPIFGYSLPKKQIKRRQKTDILPRMI